MKNPKNRRNHFSKPEQIEKEGAQADAMPVPSRGATRILIADKGTDFNNGRYAKTVSLIFIDPPQSVGKAVVKGDVERRLKALESEFNSLVDSKTPKRLRKKKDEGK